MVAGGGAKRHHRTAIQNLQPTLEGSRMSGAPPRCMRTFQRSTGGLRFAATPGYHLPTLRVGRSCCLLNSRRTPNHRQSFLSSNSPTLAQDPSAGVHRRGNRSRLRPRPPLHKTFPQRVRLPKKPRTARPSEPSTAASSCLAAASAKADQPGNAANLD